MKRLSKVLLQTWMGTSTYPMTGRVLGIYEASEQPVLLFEHDPEDNNNIRWQEICAVKDGDTIPEITCYDYIGTWYDRKNFLAFHYFARR